MRRAAALTACGAALVAGCGGTGGGGGGGGDAGKGEQARAVAPAKAAYREAKAAGRDLGRGPCIAETLPGLPDWVADVAHDPRRPVDDVPANQCARFRSGQAHHFVELDPQGRLIRAQ